MPNVTSKANTTMVDGPDVHICPGQIQWSDRIWFNFCLHIRQKENVCFVCVCVLFTSNKAARGDIFVIYEISRWHQLLLSATIISIRINRWRPKIIIIIIHTTYYYIYNNERADHRHNLFYIFFVYSGCTTHVFVCRVSCPCVDKDKIAALFSRLYLCRIA